MNGSGDVFEVGGTNRLDILDRALLLVGRFDRLVYLCETEFYERQLCKHRIETSPWRREPE